MQRRVEGSISIQGLIEGGLGDGPDGRKVLEDWVSLCRRNGLPFVLAVEGERFNLLADEKPIAVEKLGACPQDTLRALLPQLAAACASAPQRLYSTLRSSEYQPGREIQCVYPVLSDGSIGVQQRTVAVDTEAPPKPLSLERRLALAGGALLALALVTFAASFFVDFRAVGERITASFVPIRGENVRIDLGSLGGYIEAAGTEVDSTRRLLRVTLARGARFPADIAAVEARLAAPDVKLGERLALESLVRGYARCELFDGEGVYLGNQQARLKPLWAAPSTEAAFAIPDGVRLAALRCEAM